MHNECLLTTALRMLRDSLLKENKDRPKAFANNTLNGKLTTASSYKPQDQLVDYPEAKNPTVTCYSFK